MYNCEQNYSFMNSSLDGFQNESDEYRLHFFNELQLEKNLALVPTFIYLASLFIMGVIGNPLIILVYSREKKKTATTYFIVSIAVVDLIATLITLPVTFYVNFRSLDMDNIYVCKLYFFVNFTNATISTFLLLAVAVVRYRKICHPLEWQVSTCQARNTNLVIAFSCLFFSIAHIIVHGRLEKQTEMPGLCLHLCYVDEQLMATPWPKVTIGAFTLLFLVDSGVICFLYTRIAKQARKQGTNQRTFSKYCEKNTGSDSQSSSRDNELNCSQITALEPTQSSIQWLENTIYKSSEKNDVIYCPNPKEIVKNPNSFHLFKPRGSCHNVCSLSSPNSKLKLHPDTTNKNTKQKHKKRTTFMLFTITVIYVVTNLTTLILMFVRAAAIDHILALSPVWTSLYSLFFNLFLLNCALNPIIYSLWNKNFRLECFKFFGKIRRS
ncbi:cholecystokinin receptor type A [Biomphalaria glabrata]|nr:cholecystokinin receptor type A-like [Biomphalaria glabrata]